MYLEHFGIKELPFSLTPNTQFFLSMASYHKAFNMLMVSIANREGFIKVVGEVGTGKTMLCRKVLNSLEEDATTYVTAYIANPVLSPKGLLLAFAEEIGLAEDVDTGHHSLLKKITKRLMQLSAEGKQVILFIDEAHAMPEKTLEALRLLTNLETEKVKLFQVILFAQPELDTMLEQPSLRQLLQRITFSYRLEPLDREGLERYVTHRLATAGYNGPALFGRRALDVLFQASRGIPRVINILCHKALMVAYGKGERTVDLEHVRRAVEDTEGVSLVTVSYRSVSFAGVALLAGVALVVYLISYYNGSVP
ncbi:MAG: AAA family ATPase [Gammaproteobacteria bacterium RIFCSPLOWO2_02_FULL_57_10]|nr:MAG: AAA family ATPase [Gammaproteobacteria bacterium RIFCSPLOWO2_02_FULL_57_10]